jgi:enoyl-CoA hydratase/carnithine racemase
VIEAKTEFFRTELSDHVALVTFDRPPVNAISKKVGDELALTVAELADRGEVYAVVLTGGDRIFSAGVDIKELSLENAGDPTQAVPRNRRFEAICQTISGLRVPVIAAVNGYALGGGCMIPLYCDVRVAAEDASFGLPEINLGGVPGFGMQRLSRTVGQAKTKQLVLTGEPIDGREAYRIGLVDVLAGPGQAVPAALELAKRIASKPPLSVQACKQAISLGAELPIERAQAIDLLFVEKVAGTEDRAESLRAFLEKRPPRLVGR